MDILFYVIFAIGCYCIGVVAILVYYFHMLGNNIICKEEEWKKSLYWPIFVLLVVLLTPFYYFSITLIKILLCGEKTRKWIIEHSSDFNWYFGNKNNVIVKAVLWGIIYTVGHFDNVEDARTYCNEHSHQKEINDDNDDNGALPLN